MFKSKSIQKSVTQLSTVTKNLSEIGLLFVNWAIQKKREGVLRTYSFKKSTEISQFVFLPLEILNKTKLYLWKSCKIDF